MSSHGKDFHPEPIHLTKQPSLRKRDSKKSKVDSAQHAKLLETYNDLKSIQESKEFPSRQVYMRRIGLGLVKAMPQLFRFPVLQYVEETTKIMLINEMELLYWYDLMKKYLQKIQISESFTAESVKLFFFQSAIFVKKFLFQVQKQRGYIGHLSPFKASRNKFEDQIESILAYIKQYHYQNFEEVYAKFDRTENILLDPRFLQMGQEFQPDLYESYSYLGGLTIKDLHEIFMELKLPFETDTKENIIDYNWHVDGILKNSQSYNKDNSHKENQKAVAITKQDMQLTQKGAIRGKPQGKLAPAAVAADVKDLRMAKGNSRQHMARGHSGVNEQPELMTFPSTNLAFNQYLPNLMQNESFPLLNFPSLMNQDSLFFGNNFQPGLGLQRNASIRSNRSNADEDKQPNGIFKPISKKSNANLKLSSYDLSKINADQINKAFQNLEGSKMFDLDQDISPFQLGPMERNPSASQFLFSTGQIPLEKRTSIVGFLPYNSKERNDVFLGTMKKDSMEESNNNNNDKAKKKDLHDKGK